MPSNIILQSPSSATHWSWAAAVRSPCSYAAAVVRFLGSTGSCATCPASGEVRSSSTVFRKIFAFCSASGPPSRVAQLVWSASCLACSPLAWHPSCPPVLQYTVHWACPRSSAWGPHLCLCPFSRPSVWGPQMCFCNDPMLFSWVYCLRPLVPLFSSFWLSNKNCVCLFGSSAFDAP